MRSFLALQYKELRQNALLFFLPMAVLFLLSAAASNGLVELDEGLRDILALVVPVALAVAFGLQTFDLEENHRTRDFLLTKPLTPGRIFMAKFVSGLLQLLPSALLWIWILTPEAVRFPSFSDYSTYWFISCLFLLLAVYTACVLAGVLIKGPQKVLFGTLLSALAAAWFFSGFFSILAAIIHLKGPAGPAWTWLAVAAGLALLSFLSICLSWAVRRHLINTPLIAARGKPLVCLICLCVLPFLALGVSTLTRPAIRPFTSLFSTFLGQEQWFAAISGVRQPGGGLYVFADAHGRLGLGRIGQKPQVVYESPAKDSPLTALAWSPDGRSVTFHQDGLIFLYNLRTGKALPVMHGDAAIWSSDPQKMMVLRVFPDHEGEYGLYLADLSAGTASLKGFLKKDNELDLAWDGDGSRLLVVERGWKLSLIGLEKEGVQTMDLTPYPGCPEVAVAARYFPSAAGGRHFAVLAVDRSRSAGVNRRFNAYFYELDPRELALKRTGTLRDVFFEELAGDPASNELIGLIGMGVYRAVSLPKEGS